MLPNFLVNLHHKIKYGDEWGMFNRVGGEKTQNQTANLCNIWWNVQKNNPFWAKFVLLHPSFWYTYIVLPCGMLTKGEHRCNSNFYN